MRLLPLSAAALLLLSACATTGGGSQTAETADKQPAAKTEGAAGAGQDCTPSGTRLSRRGC
ncbi:MAG TPA: hypothetical protein VEB20_16810 [Azospirillaceae bacterium]|nr:hypothetical protein [Azospirillaceae bacterium]